MRTIVQAVFVMWLFVTFGLVTFWNLYSPDPLQQARRSNYPTAARNNHLPFRTALFVGFKFYPGHDWLFGFPCYTAQRFEQLYILQITTEEVFLFVRLYDDCTHSKEDFSEFLKDLDEEPVDLLVIRRFTLVSIVKKQAPSILFQSRLSALIPILPESKRAWTVRYMQEQQPWLDFYVADNSFLKPPHLPTANFSKAELALHTPKQMLVFVATISKRKGHLDFAQLLPANFPAKIIFLGDDQKEPDVVKELVAQLHEKKVDFEILGNVEFGQLQQFYIEADGVVLFSQADPSPRVIFEALFHNLPFLISSQVKLPSILLQSSFNLGMVCNSSKPVEQLQEQMLQFIETDHKFDAYNFAQKYLTEDASYGRLLQEMADAYQETGRVVVASNAF